MDLFLRRMTPWFLVALAFFLGCIAWNIYWESGRPQPPPPGWEDSLAGTWCACHPAPLAGKVEIRFKPSKKFTLIGGDRVVPALTALYLIGPCSEAGVPLDAPKVDGCYTTSESEVGVAPC